MKTLLDMTHELKQNLVIYDHEYIRGIREAGGKEEALEGQEEDELDADFIARVDRHLARD